MLSYVFTCIWAFFLFFGNNSTRIHRREVNWVRSKKLGNSGSPVHLLASNQIHLAALRTAPCPGRSMASQTPIPAKYGAASRALLLVDNAPFIAPRLFAFLGSIASPTFAQQHISSVESIDRVFHGHWKVSSRRTKLSWVSRGGCLIPVSTYSEETSDNRNNAELPLQPRNIVVPVDGGSPESRRISFSFSPSPLAVSLSDRSLPPASPLVSASATCIA